MTVELSKPLLLSVKMPRQRYEKYLDQERQKKKLNRNGRKESVCWKRLMKSKRRRELMLRLSHSMTQPMNFLPKQRLL